MIFLLQETEAQKLSDWFKLSQQAEWHNRPLDSQFTALSRAPRQRQRRGEPDPLGKESILKPFWDADHGWCVVLAGKTISGYNYSAVETEDKNC